MAINLAHRMVKERKMPVTIWLNVTGVRLADKRLVQPMFSDAHTPLEKLQAFMRDGGKVMICPMCMRNMGGMEIADLPNGVVPSEVDVWEAALFADGVRTLSY
jgi:sulfur relay (sulfurtransferase) complex TusBCD TusD component (DsrE family)